MKNRIVFFFIVSLIALITVSAFPTNEDNKKIDISGKIHVSALSITHPSNKTIFEMTTGNVITWTVSGTWDSMLTRPYNVFRDDVRIASGYWNPGESISINIDGMTNGYYKFLIVFRNFEGLGITVEDDVYITVVENYGLDLVIIAMINVTIIVFLMLYVRPRVISFKKKKYLSDMDLLIQEYPDSTLLKEIAVKISEGANPRTIFTRSPDPSEDQNLTELDNVTIGDAIRAELDRLDAEQEDNERIAAEEAKMREMFKKFMAEESNKYAGDVDKMFDEWKKGKEKI